MFTKKFKLRIYSSPYSSDCFYVQYTYYWLIPNWHDIYYKLHGGTGIYKVFTEYANAEKFAEQFSSIEKVRDYNNILEEVNAHKKTKIIYKN